jgi:hypothetical protein
LNNGRACKPIQYRTSISLIEITFLDSYFLYAPRREKKKA